MQVTAKTSSGARAEFLECADEFSSGCSFGPVSHCVISRRVRDLLFPSPCECLFSVLGADF